MGAWDRTGGPLRDMREAAGRTLAEAAGESGVRESRLRRYEAGRSHPGYRDLIRLANYYGMGAGELARRLAARAA